MGSKDAYFLLAPDSSPRFAIMGAVISKTKTEQIKRDLERRVFPNKKRGRLFPVNILGKAYWAEDKHFNLDSHLITVKQPIVSMDELGALAASVASQPLAPNKPLWRVYIVENFQDDSAVIVHYHHVYLDAMAFVNTFVHNSDPQCPRTFFSLDKSASWRKVLGVPLALALIPYGVIAGMRHVPDCNPLTKVPQSSHKTIVVTPLLSLSLHISRAKAQGVTFNDYIIATALKAVSAYIARQHGTQHHNFTVMVPYSFREPPKDGSPLPPGNDITMLALPMPAVTSAALAKEVAKVIKQALAFPVLIQTSGLMLRGATLLPKAICLKIMLKLKHSITLTVSNVQGSKAPLSYGGVQIKYLFGTPIHGCPVIATVMSYAEHFTVTFTSDLAVIPNLSELSRIFVAELTNPQ